MKNVQIMLLIATGLLVAACGKDEGEQTQKAAIPATASPPHETMAAAAPPPATPATMEADTGTTRYIDHAKDEIEFRLKKSLAGLESLLEDVSDPEQIETMKKDIADLKSKLAEL
jgi:hypothetical protein